MPSPPLTNMKPVVIDFDHGQQIIIEGDTIYKQIRSDDPDPTRYLLLEHGGRCIAFTFEGGMWWQSEYTGGADKVPQLNIKYQAEGGEREERERARRRWEQEHNDIAQPPVLYPARNAFTPPQWDDQSYSKYDDGFASGSRGYPQAFVQTQPAQAQSPLANVENSIQYSDSRFATDPDYVPGNHSQQRWHNNWQPGIQPPFRQSWSNQRPYCSNQNSLLPPQYSETSPSSEILYAPGTSPPGDGANRRARIDGGVYTNIGGSVEDLNVDASTHILGQRHYINASPDYHQELNGRYMSGPWGWSR